MWHNTERLEEWFAAVKERWKNPSLREETVETSNWTANSLTDEYR